MKLVELDQDICPYLTVLMVAAMAKVGQVLHAPRRLEVGKGSETEFDFLLWTMAGQQYHSHGTLGRELGGGVLEQYPWSQGFQQPLKQQGATQARLSQQADV